ncbi:hypothetical protein PAHAL_6G067700 [Panicum hallii]|uniref:MBD domain-containing protein n=1 Tax=Panicum hallii TaxID=206008 RepID=A0A2S3I124_9POAL|nr:methyl-CpG-binding domain-containing protein 13-like isoform X3 [Panicum hallii]PAN34071.1 hypothetical protein PAHAL_6G067700 [Panicum hallii]
MQSDWRSCPRIQSRVVRVNCVMDSGSSSCSRTRSGLVRRKGIFAPSKASCSRTRSGLVRIKSFIHSRDGSCSRTRSGLVRMKSFVDSSDSSCSRTRSDPVRGSPQVVEDEEVLKGSPDGWVKEDSPVRTQNVKGSPAAKAVTMDEPVTKGLPDGCLNDEMPSRTRSGLVRRRPTFKILSKDQPVIKGLADGWLKEDTPPGTRSGLVRGSLASKAPVKAELVRKAQHDGWLKKDKPAGTQSDLVGGRPAVKTLQKNGRVIEGLPDGWRKEYRPRKIGSFQDPFYIDPVSGYEFRSLKDVHRYLETGDIDQCAMKPKKGSTIYDVHITESQTLTSSSSQRTKPSTADKGIQCEILTSEGIMMPWEKLVTPYSENDTEDTVLPESESLKAMQGYGDKLETLEHRSVEPVSAQCGTRETKSLKRKEQNVEVRSKKRKANPAVTTIRVSPRLAALNVQQEASIEPEDQPINVNPIDRVHTIEENSNDLSQMSQSGTVNQIHGNLESTSIHLQLSQADTAEGMEDIQENTTSHSQLSQVDTVNHIQTNQEKTASQVESILADIPVLEDRSIIDHADIPIQTMQECTKDPLSQADIVNHIQTDQDFTANQLQLSLADTVIPVQPFQEYTISYSQPVKADTINQIQANQESTCDRFHLSQVDTVTKMQIIQENLTRQPNLSQADNVGQAHIDLESTIDYSQLSKADTINQLQANQENTADQLHFSQADCVTQIQTIQGNMSKHPQLSQADTVDRIHINREGTTNHLQPNYAENSMLQASLSWAPEQNGGADFWKNFENHDSLVPMPVGGATVASFPANVRFQNAAGTEEPALPAQSAAPETGSDQSGLAFQSIFGNAWSDPCIEFAFKTLTGDIPVLDDTTVVTEYFPEQQDLNKDPSPNCSASVLDNTKNHTQVDVNLPAPMPSDKLYNGSWFPPQ